MVESQRNTEGDDIMIGRCAQTDSDGNQIYPNDIVLPMSDRAISRFHCKLITKEFFNQKVHYHDSFIHFLLYVRTLPKHILKLIGSFLQLDKNLYIQDVGSVYGTYYRLQNTRPQQMERAQIYFIGADTNFTVQDCVTSNHKSNTKLSLDKMYNLLADYEHHKTKIHGLTDLEYQEVKSISYYYIHYYNNREE